MCLDVYRLTKKPAQTALTSQSEDFPLSVSKSEAKTKLLLSWVTRSLPQFTPTTLALDLSHFFFFILGSSGLVILSSLWRRELQYFYPTGQLLFFDKTNLNMDLFFMTN